MLNNYYRPSDKIIEEIDAVAKEYIITNDLNMKRDAASKICSEICIELGYEPNDFNRGNMLPIFTYHFKKSVSKYISMKYNGGLNEYKTE